MGLFSFVGDIFDSAKDWMEDKIDDAVYWVEDKIDNFLNAIAPEKSYDGDTADINTTERLNTILREFSDKYMKSAVTIEKNCVKAVEDYYNKLMPVVENARELRFSTSAVRKIKNNKEEMKKSINNSIEKPLRKRLSLDDRECLEILKLDSGTRKKEKMDLFVRKVIKEARDNLANEVKKSLDMQMDDIEEAFHEMKEKQEKEFNNIMEAFKKISDSIVSETGDKEKACVLPIIVIEMSEEVLRLLA